MLRVPGLDITVVVAMTKAATDIDHVTNPRGPEAGPSRGEGGGVEGPWPHGAAGVGHRLTAR